MGSCMAETGIVRFPGSLDPSAEEFRPRNITNPPLQGTNTVIPTAPPQPHQLFFPLYPPTVLPYTHHHLHQFPVLPLTYVAAAPILLPAQTPSSAATRSLLLSLVPTDVTESAVRRELEAFGELRGVQMERLSDGIVTVHFYDLRHAESALREIRNQLLQQQSRIRRYYTSYYGNVAYSVNRLVEDFQPVNTPLSSPVRAGLITGRAVWAQFVSPSSNATISDSHNQGTIVVFNLDSEVSTTFLKGIFEVYGAVRELKETPTKKQQRFVEFYDVRGAAKALNDMNGKAVFGKPVVIEFSRPGGHYNNNNNRNNNKSSSFNAASCHGLQNPQRPPPPPPPVPRHFPSHHPPLPPPRSYHSRQVSHQIFPTKKLSSAKKAILNNNSVVVERDLEKKTASSDSKKCGGHYNNSINKVSRKGGGRTSSSRKHDSRFLIDTNAMLESDFRDSRTTVMIKNIPNKYSLKLLLNMLDNHCIHCNEQIMADFDDHYRQQQQQPPPFSAYDFVYLPIDFNNKCNVGYGFVNMTSPEAIRRLYKAFHLQHWEVFNSRKICEVTYARVQGLEALKEHFKNSKFPSEMDHYLPVLFSPSRDGKSHLTEPLPIVARCCNHQPDLIPSVGSTISQNPDDQDQNDEMDGDEARLNTTTTTTDHLLLAGSGSSENGGIVGDNINEDGDDYSKNTDS